MALSRIGILSSRLCFEGVLLNFSKLSLQHCCNYKMLTSLSVKSSVNNVFRCIQSSGTGKPQEDTTAVKLSQAARLKQAVRDYGATIIVFHVAISLASLGICYLAVSNGIDAVALLKRIGFPESVVSSHVAVGGSTFVMAYAVHKLFAPVRIAITLSSAPFIVRYLRRINLIKPPKTKT